MQPNLSCDPATPHPRESSITLASNNSSGRWSVPSTYQGPNSSRRRLFGSMDPSNSDLQLVENYDPRLSHHTSTLAPTPPTLSPRSSYPQSTSIGTVAKPSFVYRDSTLRMMSSSPQSRRSVSSTTSQQTPPSVKGKRQFFPRTFRFRPKGVERPQVTSSYKHKTAMFSNERTMLHWMHTTVNLGSLSMMLLSFGSNAFTPYIGVALLMVCLSMLIYSVTTFQVRMEWLIMSRDDVVYYDRWTPVILTLALFATYSLNLAIALKGDFKPSEYPKGQLGGALMGGDGSWS